MAPQGTAPAFVVPVLGRGWSIVVRRHGPDWWALTADERQALLDLLDHLHAEHDGPLRVQFASGGEHAHLDVALTTDRLHDGPARPLLPALADLIDTGAIQAADLVVAFVMVSGLRLLQPQLDAVLDRGGRVRLLTTDYLGVTEKAALEILLARVREYGERFEVRVYRAGALSFHPKVIRWPVPVQIRRRLWAAPTPVRRGCVTGSSGRWRHGTWQPCRRCGTRSSICGLPRSRRS